MVPDVTESGGKTLLLMQGVLVDPQHHRALLGDALCCFAAVVISIKAHRGIIHSFDVKDLAFLTRYGIKEQVRQYGQFQLRFADPTKVAFCLSLTPPFNGFQYKITAAIIELP